jgi:AcrR family transcriptional regulator
MPKLTKQTEATASRGRGRPRCEKAHQCILDAAYELLQEVGFAALTVEGVAARAGVGKPTIYRRWANKAQLAMDAFLTAVNPELSFPDTGLVKEDFREQMQQLLKVMQSPRGETIATIIGGAQMDTDLIEAFRENWLMPRRKEAKQVFKRGVERGELQKDIDLDIAIDLLYSPLLYRLLLKHAPLTSDFVDGLIDAVMGGLAKS